MTILSGYATTKVILNIDKEDEILNKKRFLIKPIGKIYKEKDFYSWKYAKIVRNGLWRNKYIETEEDRKYKIALEKQKRQNMIKKNKIVDIEETLETFTTQGNAFTFAYNLPPINISDKEWDAFLNTVYEEFKRNNLTEKFQEYILHVFRITCAKAIVHGDNSITIHDLIDNLSFLQSYKEYLNEEKRVNSIKDNILFNLNNDIITFTKNPDNIIAEFAPNNENNQSITKSENKVISLKKVAKSKK